ncbi:MAG: hypothetical protein DRO39_01425 [Thermoprotei archaeon]|nr:MAG: hypothetical protein DRO39_01425 [Thermoprotei archaeon]
MKPIALMLLCLGLTSIGALLIVAMNTVAPLIMDELSIPPSIMGFAIAAVTLNAFLSSPLIGVLIDRFGPVRVGVAGLLTMSLATLLTSMANSAGWLVATRLLLGLVSPALWPSCAKLVSLYVPQSMVGVATALYDAGSIVGLAASYVIVGFAEASWRRSLVYTSAMGIAYAVLYAVAIRRLWGYHQADVHEERVGTRTLRSSLGTVALLLAGFFLTLQTWGLLISWTSTFFVKELGLKYQDLVLYMVLVAILGTCAEVIAGLISDRMGGLRGRKFVIAVGQGVTTAALLGLYAVPERSASLLLTLAAFVSYKFATVTFWAVINDVVPPAIVGRVSGLYSMSAQLALFTSPVLNGFLIEVAGSLRIGFLYSAITLTISTAAYLALKPMEGARS